LSEKNGLNSKTASHTTERAVGDADHAVLSTRRISRRHCNNYWPSIAVSGKDQTITNFDGFSIAVKTSAISVNHDNLATTKKTSCYSRWQFGAVPKWKSPHKSHCGPVVFPVQFVHQPVAGSQVAERPLQRHRTHLPPLFC
jgi:hypothetical protein